MLPLSDSMIASIDSVHCAQKGVEAVWTGNFRRSADNRSEDSSEKHWQNSSGRARGKTSQRADCQESYFCCFQVNQRRDAIVYFHADRIADVVRQVLLEVLLEVHREFWEFQRVSLSEKFLEVAKSLVQRVLSMSSDTDGEMLRLTVSDRFPQRLPSFNPRPPMAGGQRLEV